MDTIREAIGDLVQRSGLAKVSRSAIIVVGALIVLGGLGILWQSGAAAHDEVLMATSDEPPLALGAQSTMDSGESAEPTTPAVVFAHVVGAVRTPGVYELPDGARVADAVEAAGGFLGNAAAHGVNLARVLSDGEQLLVPTVDELASGELPGPVQGSTGGGDGLSGPLDLNSADQAALEGLPGIGPSTAQKILSDRDTNGPFERPEDLMRVSGIGPKKVEALAKLVITR